MRYSHQVVTQFGLNGNAQTDLKIALVNEDVTYKCGSEPQTMDHLLRCQLLEQECRAADLAEFNDRAKRLCSALTETQYVAYV